MISKANRTAFLMVLFRCERRGAGTRRREHRLLKPAFGLFSQGLSPRKYARVHSVCQQVFPVSEPGAVATGRSRFSAVN